MMEDSLKYLPLLNVFVIPGLVIFYKVARALEKLDAFMIDSKADREKLHTQVDAIERVMLQRGML
jgi:hypothetical protein